MPRVKSEKAAQNQSDSLFLSNINKVGETLDGIAVKIEQNSQTNFNIITKRTDDVKNLKEIIVVQTADNKKLADDTKELKEIICHQNKTMVDLISDVKILVKTNLSPGLTSTTYLDKFPLHSKEDIINMENEITLKTKDAIIATVKNIVGREDIRKKITSIFSSKLLMGNNVTGKQEKGFNMNGTQKQRRLLDYPKLMNAIYKAVYKEQMVSKDKFVREMKAGIRLVKNKMYKDRHVEKMNRTGTPNTENTKTIDNYNNRESVALNNEKSANNSDESSSENDENNSGFLNQKILSFWEL